MVFPQPVNIREEMSDLIPKRSYATHNFDRYPAKMIPHLARFAILRCSKPGDSVFDPFCGCGTVLIESRITNRTATGIDINPYAVLLTRTKSHLYQERILKDAIYRVVQNAPKIKPSKEMPEWINYWFTPTTLKRLLSIREAIEILEGEISPIYINALKTILAVTIRLSSKADPRSPKPFISKKARLERVGQDFNSLEIFIKEGNRFLEATKEYRSLISNGHSNRIRVFSDDAYKLKNNRKIGIFDAVITSPPYLSAQDYYRSSKLEITILGLLEKEELDRLGPKLLGSGRGHQKNDALDRLYFIPEEIKKLSEIDFHSALVVGNYLNDMTEVLIGCHKHLKEGGYCCLIIGDSTIRKIPLPVHKWMIRISKHIGFQLEEHLVDMVKNRRVPAPRHGHDSVIMYEHILIFKKNRSS